jgi:hypothetical protein
VLVANDIAHWAERFMGMLEQPPHAGNERVRAAAGR